MKLRSCIRVLNIFRNLYFLSFLNGFMLACLLYFKIESKYENGLFLSIIASIDARIDVNDSPDSVMIKAMDYCHQMMANRAFAPGNADLGPEAGIFHSTIFDLMTTQGACGSYSRVLARIADGYGYPVRVAQMKAKGIFAGHNIVEVRTGRDWAVLDPTYNLYFVRPDARLASFADVRQNWAYYSRQVPKDYNALYRYEDVRYTNWSKVPLLFPAIKWLLDRCIGAERADAICLRTLFMNTYACYFNVVVILYILLLLVTVKRIMATRPRAGMLFASAYYSNLLTYVSKKNR